MKKLLGILCLSGMMASAIAAETTAGQPPMPMPSMDPVCMQAMEHMRANHAQLESAIKANDANKVGTIVIANHKYMESFIAKNPQCKPQHRPPMPPPPMGQ